MAAHRSLLLAAAVALGGIPLAAAAQAHADHPSRQCPMPGMPEMTMPCPDSAAASASAAGPDLRMHGPLGLSTFRQGSGTSWVPDAVTPAFYHIPTHGWDVMAHGLLFAQVNRQAGPRGDTQAGSINWSMVMASHPLAGGRLQLRAMNSLEAWTVTPRGYPILLQSGETYRGAPIRDRQHPHDLFMELGAFYERQLAPGLAAQLYAAASGEPALGPVAFMHRPSAENDPMVGLGHHWQDATHISFGVLTAGVYGRRWKLEGSAFNGREPDENRWNLELGHPLDSYAGRVTVNPTASWSLSTSFGYLHAPEAPRSGESMHRVTAAALHGRRIGEAGRWSSAIVWGANQESGHGALEHSFLAETNFEPDGRLALFGRVEYVQKTAADLAIATLDPHAPLDVVSLSGGVARDVVTALRTAGGLGARLTVNVVPPAVERLYGSRTPLGLVVYFRLRPARRDTGEMRDMGETSRAAARHSPHA